MQNRISYLDGLRGIAILLVIFFHAFSRWMDVVPYGNSYSEITLFKYGYFGVHLFFIISGFVIFMTLEKCETWSIFLYKRWLRLFPAMLICSLLVFFTASIFNERPSGSPQLKDLIPGLTFIEPFFWEKLGANFNSLEGAFWSLYVEFKFYLFSAFVFYFVGRRLLIPALALCFVVYLVLEFFDSLFESSLANTSFALTSYLDFKYYGWFAAGASYYMYYKTSNNFWFGVAMIMCILSSYIFASDGVVEFIFVLMLCIIFSVALKSETLRKILSLKILLFLGFISYPLYLIHENIMISLTIQGHQYFPEVPLIILPIAGILFVVGVASLVAVYFEKRLKLSLDMLFRSVKGRMFLQKPQL